MGLSRLGGFKLAGSWVGLYMCSSLVGHMYRERKGFEGCPCLVLANHTLWAGSRIDCPAQAFYLPRNIRKATSFLRGTLSHKTLVLIINLLIKLLLTVRGLPESRKRSHDHVRVF